MLRCLRASSKDATRFALPLVSSQSSVFSRRACSGTTATTTAGDSTNKSVAQSSNSPTTPAAGGAADSSSMRVQPAPHRMVGGVFLVRCEDHPFKHGWEVNLMLRELRLEFRGQVTIHPDVPDVRKRLWRTRHVVRFERIDLDEAKELVGIPKHITFRDLARQIPRTFGRTKSVANPSLRSKMNFMQYRKMRIRDILHRDSVEKALLEEKRRALQRGASPSSTSPVQEAPISAAT